MNDSLAGFVLTNAQVLCCAKLFGKKKTKTKKKKRAVRCCCCNHRHHIVIHAPTPATWQMQWPETNIHPSGEGRAPLLNIVRSGDTPPYDENAASHGSCHSV